MSYTLTYAQGGLPAAADYIRSKGRNEDTQLIHMTPGEIDALQQMAVQHGGSLTINPETGLPEAGFLKDLLKVALPVGLAVFGGPAAAALGGKLGLSGALAQGVGMGLLSGGLGTLMTGDLEKGLGMGLTSGLMSGAMASFGGAKVDPSAVKTPVAAQVIPQATTAPVNQGLTSMMQNPTIINPVQAQNAAGFNLANAQRGINAQFVSPVGATLANTTQAAQTGVAAGNVAANQAQPGMLDQASAWWKRQDTPTQLGIGAAGLGALSAMSENKFKPQPVDKGDIRPYTYAANQAPQEDYNGPMYDERGNAILDKRERNYYSPSYTAQPVYSAAQGGLMSAPLVDGNMYPQSQQVHTNFATPTQMPTSAEVVNADYEMKTDPFTGASVGMAQGGIARYADGGIPQARNLSELGNMPGALPRDSSPTGNMSYMNGGGGWAADYYKNKQAQQQQQPQAESYQYTYDPATQTFNKVPQLQVQNNSPSNGFEGFGQAMFGNFANDGLVGGLMGKLFPQLSQTSGGGQYQYNPNDQKYTKMAEGGNITEGYKGYGQEDYVKRNPIELLQMLNKEEKPAPQATVIKQAQGGLSALGGYSDGGRMLKGPGDGMSDNIPATIGGKQPARLADGEFVIPADVVSHLGNGSTDAGAKRLYSMMDKVRHARTGNKKQGKQIKAEKYLPK